MTQTHEASVAATGTARPSRLSAGVLWASACLLAALIMVQAGRTAAPSPAHADVVASAAGTTALTFTATNEDLLAVIDGRQEVLLLYRVDNRNALELLRSYNLPATFAEARARAGAGGGRPR